MQTGKLRLLAAAFGAALVLAACGGGGDPVPPKANIQRVAVAGDSLADVRVRLQVHGAELGESRDRFPIFTELVAQNFGITGQCNFFVFTGATFVQNSTAGCTNFAIGASRITNSLPRAARLDRNPFPCSWPRRSRPWAARTRRATSCWWTAAATTPGTC